MPGAIVRRDTVVPPVKVRSTATRTRKNIERDGESGRNGMVIVLLRACMWAERKRVEVSEERAIPQMRMSDVVLEVAAGSYPQSARHRDH